MLAFVMANLIPKTPPETWVNLAKRALVEDGINGVKVDRLAQRLGVTRGGFYKHFTDRGNLLERLLELWEKENIFALPLPTLKTPQQARDAFNQLNDRLIEEDGFNPEFDLAVRDWARHDRRAAWALQRVDAKRIDLLRQLFLTIGCDEEEAALRAGVFYYHQIGYYAIGVEQSTAERKRLLPMYMRILIGAEHFDGPEAAVLRKSRPKKAA